MFFARARAEQVDDFLNGKLSKRNNCENYNNVVRIRRFSKRIDLKPVNECFI